MCVAAPAGHSEQVIHEVDEALRALIERERRPAPTSRSSSTRPTKDWAGPAQRADHRRLPLRHPRGPAPPRARPDQRVRRATGSAARHLPPRYFKLSYLVTAWTQRPEDEHRLLSALLVVLPAARRAARRPADRPAGRARAAGRRSRSRCRRRRTGRSPTSGRRSAASSSRRWTSWSSAPTDTGQQLPAGPPVDGAAGRRLGGVGGWPPREPRRARWPVGTAAAPAG